MTSSGISTGISLVQTLTNDEGEGTRTFPTPAILVKTTSESYHFFVLMNPLLRERLHAQVLCATFMYNTSAAETAASTAQSAAQEDSDRLLSGVGADDTNIAKGGV